MCMISSLKIFFTRLRAWMAGDSWEYPIDLDFEELDYQNEEYLELLKNSKDSKNRNPLVWMPLPDPKVEGFDDINR